MIASRSDFSSSRNLELGRRQSLEHAIEEVPHPQPVLGRQQRGLLEAELEDLVREVALARRVRLVRRDDHLAAGTSEQLRDFSVNWGQALPDVEQEDDGVGLVDRDLRLRLDRGLGRILVRVQIEPGRVDHGELPPPVRDAVEPVAREARLRVDDRLAPAEDAVEQRRFADVGAADDGDDRARHASSVANSARRPDGCISSDFGHLRPDGGIPPDWVVGRGSVTRTGG